MEFLNVVFVLVVNLVALAVGTQLIVNAIGRHRHNKQRRGFHE